MINLSEIEMKKIAGGVKEIPLEIEISNKICCMALTPECLACMGIDYDAWIKATTPEMR